MEQATDEQRVADVERAELEQNLAEKDRQLEEARKEADALRAQIEGLKGTATREHLEVEKQQTKTRPASTVETILHDSDEDSEDVEEEESDSIPSYVRDKGWETEQRVRRARRRSRFPPDSTDDEEVVPKHRKQSVEAVEWRDRYRTHQSKKRATPQSERGDQKRQSPNSGRRYTGESDKVEQRLRRLLSNHGEATVSAQEQAELKLNRMTSTPFVKQIRERDPPAKFSTPHFDLYDGKSDPVNHISLFTHKMALWTSNDSLMCKMFPASMGKSASKWFHSLSPDSIASWGQLAREFVARYIANSKDPTTLDALFAMKQKRDESLKTFAPRFMECYADMEECEEKVAVTAFRLALLSDCKLRESLTLRVPASMAELQERIRQYSKLEEDKKLHKRGRSVSPVRKGASTESMADMSESLSRSKAGKGLLSDTPYTAVHTVFKIPIYKVLPKIKHEAFFKWPEKMVGDPLERDQRKFCSYHRDKGHMTEGCKALKAHLEKMVSQGYLKEFVDKEGSPQEQPKVAAEEHKQADKDVGGQRKIIHLIETSRPRNSKASRHEYRRERHEKEVMRAEGVERKSHDRTSELAMSFSDADLEGVRVPHCDPLVLTVQLGEYEVRRVLVDSGSSVEIMYYNMFKRLGKTEADLVPISTQLIGLGSFPIWPMGMLREEVTVGGKTAVVEFLVVNVPSSYNAILGRPWLHAMEAVHSTYHQLIQFPLEGKVVRVRAEQQAARQCMKTDDSITGVYVAHEEPQTLDEVRLAAADKSAEELQKIYALAGMDGKVVPRTWNTANLRKYYV